jgi:TonB family protein
VKPHFRWTSLGLLLSLLVLPSASSASLLLDRSKSLPQILADCDPATGVPYGVTLPPQAPGAPRKRVVIEPDWLRAPGAEEMAAAYPPAARAQHLAGHVMLHCLVGSDGQLRDCSVKQEEPEGAGFGGAALKLAASMIFVPRRVNCVPDDGGIVNVPFAFAPP